MSLGGQQGEAFPLSRLAQTSVQTDEFPIARAVPCPDQRRAKLEGVGRAQRMHGQRPLRPIAHVLARSDLLCHVEEQAKPPASKCLRRAIELSFACPAHDRRAALDTCPPP